MVGLREVFQGVVLLFDSQDDDKKRDNPIIMGFENDGEQASVDSAASHPHWHRYEKV